MDDLFDFDNSNTPATSNPTERINELRKAVSYHDNLYYDQAQPELTDAEYDKLFRELENLEKVHPNLYDPNSPTQRVGGKPLEGFESVQHRVPMLSIDDYFDHNEMADFYQRLIKAA